MTGSSFASTTEAWTTRRAAASAVFGHGQQPGVEGLQEEQEEAPQEETEAASVASSARSLDETGTPQGLVKLKKFKNNCNRLFLLTA